MKINQQTSILFWLAKSRKSRKGLVSIYCRITIDGRRTEFSTSKKIHPDNWQSDPGIAKGKLQESLEINRELNRIKTDLQRTYDQQEALYKHVTAEMLKIAYLGSGAKDKNIIDSFKEYNKVLLKRTTAIEGTFKKQTYTRFETTKKKMQAFLMYQYKQVDRKISLLPESFGEDLLLFLTTEENLRKNTAMKYIKNVKQMLEWAQKKEFTPKNVLADFHCSYKQPKRQHLTWDEIMTLFNKPMPNQRLEEVKDVYLFSCFTGYAYMDVYKLEPENIVPWIDGSKWVIKDRYKGDHNKSNVPLMEIPLAIIEKYKKHPYCQVYHKLLPVNSNQRYNSYLKEIAAIAGIQKQLTTHTARHTFATTITLENDCPIESVSEMLGHASIRTTQIYAKTTDVKVSNNMKNVKERIASKIQLTQTGS